MNTWKSIVKLVKEEKGISSVEYALLLALVGAAVAGAAIGLGGQISTEIQEATTSLAS